MSEELTAQLMTVQGDLEALRADFKNYAYIVSHDLAAPFRQIEGFADIILAEHGDQFDEKTQRHFNLIIKGANRGSGIVESLLHYSRLSTETVQVSRVDCNIVVADVLAELTELVQHSNAEYSCAQLPVIEADATQIRTLFYHLIQNALLYNKPDSQPAITLEGVEVDTGWEFHITDNGIGIPDKRLDDVFVPLKRCVSNKDYPGFGMGLAIAKRIVQHHRGNIQIEANEIAGCSVHFSIPKPTS